jgi:hypothetical protein
LKKLVEKSKTANGQASDLLADIRVFYGEDIEYNMENKNKRYKGE